MIAPHPHVAAMAPYALADLSAPEGKRLISLSQNESARPPSPKAAQAIRKAAENPHLYPDPDWSELRYALADLHSLNADQILCGNGSLDLIGCLARAYLSADDAALAPEHAYPFFKTATLTTGARFDTAKETNLCADIDALLAAVQPDTKIVFLANPGNPTGTRLPGAEVRRLRDALPETVLLVVDEAYGEFADHLNEPMFDLVNRGDTLVLRTFSKAYGLAGMRVGWGYFPQDIAAQMRKVMSPNNVALAGQMAGLAVLKDQAYMRATCEETATLRDNFVKRMRTAGLHVPASYTNFALLQFASEETARRVDRAMRQEGIFLRAQGGAGLPNCLRATVGVADDMDLAAELIEAALQEEAP